MNVSLNRSEISLDSKRCRSCKMRRLEIRMHFECNRNSFSNKVTHKQYLLYVNAIVTIASSLQLTTRVRIVYAPLRSRCATVCKYIEESSQSSKTSQIREESFSVAVNYSSAVTVTKRDYNTAIARGRDIPTDRR